MIGCLETLINNCQSTDRNITEERLSSQRNVNRQRAYDVTLRRVHETIVAVEKEKFYIFQCVCMCACPRARVYVTARACASARVTLIIQNARRSHIVNLRPLWLHHIFRHYLKRQDFRKKVTEHKYVF